MDASTPIKKAIVQTTFADANNYMKDGVLLRQVINVIDELDFSDYEESHAFGEIYEIEKTEILKLDPFLKLGKPAKIAGYFGGKAGYLKAVQELEQAIYTDEVV